MKFLTILFTFVCINWATADTARCEHIRVDQNIELTKINENFYIHTSWFDFPGFGRFPSNGLIFIKNENALMVDTPNTNGQTLALYNYVKDQLNATITKVIVGHSHSDCMGGLAALHEKGIESIACSKTIRICKSRNLPIPRISFDDSLTLTFEGETVICSYFGPGHTIDNITTFFPASNILFGGCLIKNLGSKGLGNTKEADVENWDTTVLKVKNEYPSITLVIPGHGTSGGSSLLDHTIRLVKKAKQ